MGRITIADIAKQAGVSMSTASRVINKVGNVSAEKCRRVNEVITKVGFRPSAVAQGLSRNGTNLIGVLLPTVSDSFFGAILQGIMESTRASGYNIILCTHDNDPVKEKEALQILSSQMIKGLMITPAVGYIKTDSTDARNYLSDELNSLDVPTVFIDRAMKMSRWDGVYYDNFNGGYLAARQIRLAGYSKVGYMFSDLALQIGYDRYRGFMQGIQDFGLELQELFVYKIDGAADIDESWRVAKRFLGTGSDYPAMFFGNGDLAKGFLKAALEKGLKIGMDLYCIGFDYVDVLDMLTLDYVYLDRDSFNMGRIATKMLMEHFDQTFDTRRDYVIPAMLRTAGRLKVLQ